MILIIHWLLMILIVRRSHSFKPDLKENNNKTNQMTVGVSLSGQHFRALTTVASTTTAKPHTTNLTDKCRGISSRAGMLHLWGFWIACIAQRGPKATVQGSVAGCQGQRLGGMRVYVTSNWQYLSRSLGSKKLNADRAKTDRIGNGVQINNHLSSIICTENRKSLVIGGYMKVKHSSSDLTSTRSRWLLPCGAEMICLITQMKNLQYVF